jgi:hypothetical protein
MKRYIMMIMAIVFSFAFTSTAIGLEFSADVINTAKGQVSTSRIYMKNKKMRWDSHASDNYNIARQDLNTSWIIMPKQKSYMEMKSSKSERIPQEKMKGEISRKLIGSESIDGHPTKKYEVTYNDGKQVLKSHQWIAADLNFPIRMAAVDGSWSMEYKNIKIGTQADSLFEIPAGYKKMAMPSMPGAGKGGLPGKMPKGYAVPGGK